MKSGRASDDPPGFTEGGCLLERVPKAELDQPRWHGGLRYLTERCWGGNIYNRREPKHRMIPEIEKLGAEL